MKVAFMLNAAELLNNKQQTLTASTVVAVGTEVSSGTGTGGTSIFNPGQGVGSGNGGGNPYANCRRTRNGWRC